MRKDVVGIGDCLIDFVTIKGEDDSKIFLEGNAGGAPANVLAMTAKLGRDAALISKVGRDVFGKYLLECVKKSGVDTSAMVSGNEPTTLAIVSLDEKGDRSFSFYRNQTADISLQITDVDMNLVENCTIFHFGSVSMTDEPARSTTLEAARRAREAGAKLSFDPNYRPLLWNSEAEAIEAMEKGLELANYVKMSDEEAVMLTGESDPEKAALVLHSRYGFDFTAVTLGARGCVGISAEARMLLPTYDVETVDTTGAGDAFWGAVLHRLLELDSKPLDEAAMTDLLCFGNAAGSLVTMKHGAISPQPTAKEIRACMKTAKLLIAD